MILRHIAETESNPACSQNRVDQGKSCKQDRVQLLETIHWTQFEDVLYEGNFLQP